MSSSLTKLCCLADVTHIRSGYALKHGVKINANTGTTPVLQIRDIQVGEIHDDSVFSRVDVNKLDTSVYLSHGDVLIPGRGERYTAAVYQGSSHRVVAISPLFVLSPCLDIEPMFLMWFLNQVPAQQQLLRLRTGSNIPMISKAALASLRIAVPSWEEQQAIADYYRAAMLERGKYQQLMLLRDQEMQSLSAALMQKACTV